LELTGGGLRAAALSFLAVSWCQA